LASDSDLRDAEHQKQLSENVAALLESNRSLSRRLMNLEDAFEVRTIVSKQQSQAVSTAGGTNDDISNTHQPNEQTEDGATSKINKTSQLSTPPEGVEVSSFDFENDLEISRVYRRAQRDTMDFSFRSSVAHTNAWSQFSGLSLGKVSIISAIALPLYPDEIENSQYYEVEQEQTLPATAAKPCAPRVRTLFENCLELGLQLSQFPGLSEIFATDRECIKEADPLSVSFGLEADPLSIIIQVFRRGTPLLMLLERVPGIQNLAHLTRLEDAIDEQKIPKVATFRFIKACIDDLGFQPHECFSVTDLFGTDTTGFIKVNAVAISAGWQSSHLIIQVVKVVTQLLDMLTISGAIEPVDRTTIVSDGERKMTDHSPRDIIIEGFMVDERSYAANLEKFPELKRKFEMEGGLRNALDDILRSLNRIVDMQRRLLIFMEMTVRKPSDVRYWIWGTYFEAWESISSTYAHFVTSEKVAKEYIRTVLAQRQIFEDDDLNSALRECLRLLPLPSQRLPKYLEFLHVRLLLHYSCSKHYSYNLYILQELC
jgi:cell division control protein 24